MPTPLTEFDEQLFSRTNPRYTVPGVEEAGWGDRLGASVDRLQSQLYGVGEAAGLDWGQARRENQVAAEIQRARAVRDTGAPESLSETFSGPGQFAKGVAGLFVDSAPELATSLAALPLGTTLGLGSVGRTALGAALNYPAAVGDILQNQRDEAGTTNLGAAGALGVPYAAADMLGLDAALASGRMMRTGISRLDDMTGWKGGLARMGANAGMNSLVEGGNETFQEGMNQLGRMSVNPEQTFINEDSLARYGESFGAGALMGGSASALMGGWRRSEGYLPPGQNLDNPEKPADLLGNGQRIAPDAQYGLQGDLFSGAGYDTSADGSPGQIRTPIRWEQDAAGNFGPVYGEEADNTSEALRRDLSALAALRQQAYDENNAAMMQAVDRATADVVARLREVETPDGLGVQRNLMSGVSEMVNGVPVELTNDELVGNQLPLVGDTNIDFPMQQGGMFQYTGGIEPTGLYTALGEQPAVPGGERVPSSQRLTTTDIPVVGTNPSVMPVDMFGNVAATPVDAANQADPGAVIARQQWAKQQESIKAAQAVKQQIEANRAAAGKYGIKGDTGVDLFVNLQELLQGGEIDQPRFNELAGMVAARQYGKVRGEIRNVGATQEVTKAVAANNAQAGQTPITKVTKPSNVQVPATQSAAAPAAAGGVPATGGAAPVEATGTVAGIDPNKKVTIGRKGREKEANAAQLVQLMRNATPIEKARIAAATGLEATTDPTTGAPRLVQVGEPQTLDAIATAESGATGKKVTREAIRLSLLKFGITPEVIDQLQGVTADTVTEAELGIDPESDGSGFRVETQLSKATGQGLVDDGNTETKAQREARAKADALLKEAGPSTTLAETKPAGDNVVDLREGNQARIEANIRAYLATPEAGIALADWLGSRYSADQLPDTIKADWVEEYAQVLEANDNEWSSDVEAQLARIATNLERTADAYFDNQGVATPTGLEVRAQRGVQSLTGGTKSAQGATDAEVKSVTPFTSRLESRSAPFLEFEDVETYMGGVDSVRQELAALGIENALDHVSDWRISNDPAEAYHGEITIEGGRYVVTLNSAKLQNPGYAAETARHEIGHAVDLTMHGGVYSAHPTMGVVIANGKVVPTGAVAEELVNLAKKDKAFGRFLEYPLNLKQHRQLNDPAKPNIVEGELFAQVFSLYTGPNGAAYLEQNAPKTAAFLKEVVNDIRTAKVLQVPTLDAAERRAAAFQNRYARSGNPGGGGLSGASQQSRRAGVTGPLNRQNDQAAEPGQWLNDAPRGVRKAHSFMGDVLRQSVRWLGTRGAFTHNLIRAASKVLPSAERFGELMRRAAVEKTQMEAEVASILDAYRQLPTNERGTGPNSVNAFLKESTSTSKWGYDTATEKADPALAEKFNRLSKPAQEVVRRVFAHGSNVLQQIQSAAMDSIKSEYDPLIAQARAEGDMEQVKRLEDAKKASDSRFRTLFALQAGKPYAPLKRFGNHAVVAMSQQYLDAEKAGDRATMEQLQSDENHYLVEFVDTPWEASARSRALRDDGYAYAANFERLDESALYGKGGVFPAFQRLRSLVEEQLEGEGTKVKKHVDKMLSDLYLTLLSETSARQTERRRKLVSGASDDMMRAFATQGRASAHFLGSLRTSGAVMEQMRAMKKEADARVGTGEDRAMKRDYLNEIVRRYAMGLDYEPSPWLDKTLAFNSYWTLLTSPAYFLTNALQPMHISLPYMAGRYGYGKSFAEFSKAYRELLPLTKQLVGNIDAIDKLPEDVRLAVKTLLDEGRIDISLSADLGSFDSGSSQASAVAQKALRFPRTVAERVEMMNRVSTAMAAYRLARGNGLSHDNAVRYAGEVIYDTHGDYSGFNAPRFMRSGVGRFATQFRKFQLIQFTLLAKLIKDSASGLTAEERKAARLALTYTLGHTFALGGIVALPGFTAISYLAGSVLGLGDDDEPDDPEGTIRRMLGGGEMADLLTRGVPNFLGVDLSNRVGMQGVLSILPYTDIEASRDGYKDIILGLAGPFFGGTLPRALDGVGLMSSGEYYKGLEQLMPTGAANVMRGVRFATEGVTKRNGDALVSGEDIGLWAGLAQAAGLPTRTVTDAYRVRNTEFKADKFYDGRTADIRREYTEAYRSGDGKKLAELRQEWQELQLAKRELGLKPTPLSSLLRAPMEQRKREREKAPEELVM